MLTIFFEVRKSSVENIYGIVSKVLLDQVFFSESLRLKYSTKRLVIVRYICRLFIAL